MRASPRRIAHNGHGSRLHLSYSSGLPDQHKPKILDYSLIDDIIAVQDRDAYETGIELARTEGIMVGPTTGAVLHAARKVAAHNSGRAVVISPDGATKYVSAYAKYLEGD